MKETIIVFGNPSYEVEVTKYEPTEEFYSIDSAGYDPADLRTDNESIYAWDDAISSYVRICHYC